MELAAVPGGQAALGVGDVTLQRLVAFAEDLIGLVRAADADVLVLEVAVDRLIGGERQDREQLIGLGTADPLTQRPGWQRR